MAEIIKFTQDADYYYNKGVEYSEKGNFVEAIDNFHTTAKLEPNNPYNFVELGYNYTEAGLYREATESYLKALALDRSIDTVYLGLMQNFINLGDGDTAFYYFKLGMENGAFEDDFNVEDYIERVERKPMLKLYEEKEDDTVIVGARRLMATGQLKLARQILEEIEEGNANYKEAINNLSYLSYLEKDYEKCISLAERNLGLDGGDRFALANAVIGYHKTGNKQKEEECAKRLDEVTPMDSETLYRTASCFMQSDNSVLAHKYYGKMLEDNPYDLVNLMVYALSLYNLGKKDEAGKYMVMLRKLYPENHSVKYYARHVIRKEIDHIPLGDVLPWGEHERRKHRIDEVFSMLSNLDAVVKRLDEDEEMKEMVTWMFEIEEYHLCKVISEFLGQHERWQEFLRERVAKPFGSPYLKRHYLTSLLLYSEKRKFSVCFDGKFRIVSPSAPTFNNEKEERIYWIAYSACVSLGVKSVAKLKKAFALMQNRIIEKDFDLASADERALSALLCNVSGVHASFSRFFDLGSFFECETENVTEYAYNLDLPRKLDAFAEFMEKLASGAMTMEQSENTDTTEGEENND